VEPLRWFERASLGRWRDSFSDLRPETPPTELQEWDDDAPGDGIDDLRAMGGPRHGDLQAHLATLPDGVTVGAAFAAAPVALHRPVEILGYLDLVATTGAGALDAGSGDVPAEDLETVRATRSDGTTREFVLPRTSIRRTDD
jgi:hypothetical protein